MESLQISIIYGLNDAVTGNEPGFNNLSFDQKTFVKDIKDGKLYIGNDTNIMTEIKTDNSNNWAKTFFYGGN